MIATRYKAILAVVVLLLGWFAGERASTELPLVQARRDVWQLSPLPRPEDGTTRAVVVAAFPQWGAESTATAAAAAAAPSAPLRWRMAGVFGSGKQGGVLLLYDGDRKSPERLIVGEKLPSGHVIERVEGNQVCIWIGKKLYRFGVENRE